MKTKYLLLLTIFFGMSLSCSKNEDPEPEANQPTEFEYNTNAIIIDETIANPVLSVSDDEKTFVLGAAAFDKTPTKGQTFLVPGEYLRKVVSAKKNGNNYEVITEDAVLTDVIKNGTIAYEITPEWGSEQGLFVDGQKARKVAGTAANIIEYQFAAKGVEYKMTIEPLQKAGKISDCKFTMQMTKKTGGRPSVSLIAEGNVSLPTQQTNITIKDGKLADFSSENKGITGTVNLSIAAADGDPGETSEMLPSIALSFPIRFLPTPYGPIPNPIPMSIDVGVQFVTSIKFSGATTSATAKSTVSFDASGGFNLNGNSVSTNGNLNNEAVTGGTFDSAGFIGSTVDVQFGVAFPRISLKVANQELAYIHVGFTTGSKLQWGPLCKSGYTKVLVEGGYGLKVLGSTIFGEKTTFVERVKEAKGSGCQ